MDRTRWASLGAVGAAIGSAICCAGPLVAVTLGFSAAGIAATFTPLRPYFVAATVLLLALGLVWLRREEQRACEPGAVCASPEARRRMRRWLWIATAVAVPAATFPWWSVFVF